MNVSNPLTQTLIGHLSYLNRWTFFLLAALLSHDTQKHTGSSGYKDTETHTERQLDKQERHNQGTEGSDTDDWCEHTRHLMLILSGNSRAAMFVMHMYLAPCLRSKVNTLLDLFFPEDRLDISQIKICWFTLQCEALRCNTDHHDWNCLQMCTCLV